MDLRLVLARCRRLWKIAILTSLGVTFCIFLPFILLVAVVILLFIVVPLFLFIVVPAQIVWFLLDILLTAKSRLSGNKGELAPSSVELARQGPRRAPSNPKPPTRTDSTETTKTASNRNSSRVVSDTEETPRNILGLLLTESAESLETLAHWQAAIAGTPPPGTAESSTDYPYDVLSPQASLLEQLSTEILDEIIRYLPESSVSALALVSKSFGSQFRFRRLHSGTEDCPLSSFVIVKNEPWWGEYTRRLVIHQTFFRPPATMQWLLQGSEESVAATTWNSTEASKQGLLEGVLRACPRLKVLVWNEGKLPLTPGILNGVYTLCTTSLRHLDISVGSRLINHLNNNLLPGSLLLETLTLRGGFQAGEFEPIVNLVLLSKTIRWVRFFHTNFGVAQEDARDLFLSLLQERSSIQRIDLISPCNMNARIIPIAHSRKLLIKHAEFTGPQEQQSQLHLFQQHTNTRIISHLTSIVLQGGDVIRLAGLSDQPALQSFSEAIRASPNLLVLSINAESALHEWTWEYTRPMPMPQNMFDAIISRQKLISVGLKTFVLNIGQLQVLCGSLTKLQHLGVMMDGDAKEISKYSQNFSRLPALIALDVMTKFQNRKCPCGHEDDDRIPHHEDGTAMGRLCRRFRLSMTPIIVRLSQSIWNFRRFPPEYEIRWINPSIAAMKQLEAVCGACDSTDEITQKIFDPATWLDVA